MVNEVPQTEGMIGGDRLPPAPAGSLAEAPRRRGRGQRRESALRELLRIRAFRRLWAAVAVSSMGDWLGLLAMTALAQQLTRDQSIATQGAAISGVVLVRLLPDLLFGAVAGAIADRLDRRMTVIIGELLAGALYLTVALSYDLTVLYVAQFLIEGIGLFTMAAKNALWVGSVPKERLALANQLSLTSVYGSVPVAAVIFALLSTVARFFDEPGGAANSDVRFAIVAALLLDVASYVVSAGLVFLTRHELAAHAVDREPQTGIWSLVREGVAFVAGHPVIRKLYVGILGAFAAGGITVGVAQLYVASLAAGTAGYSILFGTVFTGLAVGMVIGPRIFPTRSRRRIFGTAIAVCGALLLLMGVMRDFVLAVGISGGVGLAAGVAWIVGYTLIGQEVEDRLRGRTFAFVVSSVRIMLLVTVAVGPIVAGLLAPSDVPVTSGYAIELGGLRLVFSGPALTLMIAGVIALTIGAYAGRSVRRPRRGLRDSLTALARRGDALLNREVRDGVFVVVESADRALAAQQAKALADALAAEGLPVVATHEPGDTAAGRRTEELLSHRESGSSDTDGLEPETVVLLASADRSEQVAKTVRPALEAGSVVVSDGYVDTTLAFFGGDDGVDPERIMRVSAWSTEDLQPDLVVVLDAPVPDALSGVRQAFRERAEAAMQGYEVVTVDGPVEGLLPGVLAHARQVVDTRRGHLHVEADAVG